ncbi:MAG: efflux RND transporter periplasmic adaptor subunit, partial [Bacteroidota bacterium]
MKKNKKSTALALILFSLSLGLAGCSQGKEAHDHEKAEKVEKEEAFCLDQSVQDLLAARCEHQMPTYQCDECRYETGVVKVAPSILKENGGLVSLEKAVRIAPAQTITLTGELHPSDGQTVHLSPRVGGVIRRIQADLGQTVQIGQPLFEIDSMELGAAKSDFLRKKALFELAQKNLSREEKLQQARIGTGEELLNARTNREEAEIELRAAREALLRLGISPEEVSSLRPGALSGSAGYLKIRSPIRGTVLARHAAVGEIVDPEKEVMQIADLSKVWVWLDIRSSEIKPILEAQARGALPVEVSVTAFPDQVFRGKLDFANGSVDEESRTLKARATVENPKNLLRPGMFCTVRVSTP